MGEAVGVTRAAGAVRQPAYGAYTEPPELANRLEASHGQATEAGQSFRLTDCAALFALTLLEGAWLFALGYVAVRVL